MENISDGGQAFPAYRGFDAKPPHVPGMSLRDYFAAKAMQGILASSAGEVSDDWLEEMIKRVSKSSYDIADAMLKARGAMTESEIIEAAKALPNGIHPGTSVPAGETNENPRD